MNNLTSFLTNSKRFFFLDLLTFASILSITAGPLFVNFFTVLISIIFVFYAFINNLIKNFFKKNIIFLLPFFILFFFNIFFSYSPQDSLIRFAGFLRYIVFSICLIYLCNNIDSFNKKLADIFLIVFLIVISSMIIQYFNGTFMGYPSFTNHGFGLSGIFLDEYIAGSVLIKLIFFTIPALTQSKNKKLYLLLFLSIGTLFIFLANQRTPIIMITFGLILYIFLSNTLNIKLKLSFIIILFFSVLFVLKTSTGIYEKVINKTAIQFSVGKNVSFVKKVKDTQWGAHYLTAVEIYKNNKIFGSGLKTFRLVCGQEKYAIIDSEKKNIRCSTHPHNMYLEILSELGILIFLYFIIILFLIFIKLLSLLSKKTKNAAEYFVGFAILFWPLQITGSFFASFNGFFYFLGISIIIFTINKKKTNNEIY